jgi:tetrahydromethanopterin S-methyltransferase subunit G
MSQKGKVNIIKEKIEAPLPKPIDPNAEAIQKIHDRLDEIESRLKKLEKDGLQ